VWWCQGPLGTFTAKICHWKSKSGSLAVVHCAMVIIVPFQHQKIKHRSPKQCGSAQTSHNTRIHLFLLALLLLCLSLLSSLPIHCNDGELSTTDCLSIPSGSSAAESAPENLWHPLAALLRNGFWPRPSLSSPASPSSLVVFTYRYYSTTTNFWITIRLRDWYHRQIKTIRISLPLMYVRYLNQREIYQSTSSTLRNDLNTTIIMNPIDVETHSEDKYLLPSNVKDTQHTTGTTKPTETETHPHNKTIIRTMPITLLELLSQPPFTRP
jgi:hypothetical protein